MKKLIVKSIICLVLIAIGVFGLLGDYELRIEPRSHEVFCWIMIFFGAILLLLSVFEAWMDLLVEQQERHRKEIKSLRANYSKLKYKYDRK